MLYEKLLMAITKHDIHRPYFPLGCSVAIVVTLTKVQPDKGIVYLNAHEYKHIFYTLNYLR